MDVDVDVGGDCDGEDGWTVTDASGLYEINE